MKPHITLLITTIVAFPYVSMADDTPYEIKRLQVQRKSAIKKIDATYVKELQKLKMKYTKSGNLEVAIKINKEISKFASGLEPRRPSKYALHGRSIKNGKGSIPVREILIEDGRYVYLAEDGGTVKLIKILPDGSDPQPYFYTGKIDEYGTKPLHSHGVGNYRLKTK